MPTWLGPVIGIGIAYGIWGSFCVYASWRFSTARDSFRRGWTHGKWWGKPGLALSIPLVEAVWWIRWRKRCRT